MSEFEARAFPIRESMFEDPWEMGKHKTLRIIYNGHLSILCDFMANKKADGELSGKSKRVCKMYGTVYNIDCNLLLVVGA